jgi:ABC-type branched-subunit amino acid transport system ATPase component/branched-subunit amino acid ABC-type transport system permease component
MTTLLPFIIIGLTSGAVYGLAGTGVVLTYKTTGIFNLAYGSMAAMPVFIYYWLSVRLGLPWILALVLCLAVVAPAMGLAIEALARTLHSAATTIQVVALVGIILIVLSIGSLWYPNGSELTVPHFLPLGTVKVGGVFIGWDQITTIAISLALVLMLYAFFRYSPLGVAMRGVVDNPNLLSLTGQSPFRVRRSAWIIGAEFATVSGLLLAPSLGLQATTLTMLLVQAFGASAIGFFKNIPLTYVGGLLIGVGGALVTKWAATVPSLQGLTAGLPFIVLIVVLVVTPRSRLADLRVRATVKLHRSWHAPPRVRLATGVLVALALFFVPYLVGIRLNTWSQVLITAILMLSLGLLVKGSGQVSLCHYAFAAVGAVAMGHLTSVSGMPWLLALLIAGLITVPIGAAVAIPAIRLSGMFLSLATLGFGILLEQMFYPESFMFGPTTLGLRVRRPGLSIGGWDMGTDRGYYWLLLVITILVVALLTAVHRGRLGRLLRGLGDSPTGLVTFGASVNVTRLLVFGISAFLAGISGALLAGLFGYASATSFTSFGSLTLLTLVVITVIGEPWYALIAAAASTLVPSYLQGGTVSDCLQLVFGLSGVAYAFTANRPLAVPAGVRRALDRLGGRSTKGDLGLVADGGASGPDVGSVAAAPVRSGRQSAQSGLEIRQLSVRFGGLIAVDDLSLVAPLGQITALIGPNGAGKTTTFGACSGQVRPSNGTIVLDSRDITTLAAHRRARLGLGRTFQVVNLFDSLTVQENVELAYEAYLSGGGVFSQIFSSRKSRAMVRAAAKQAMALTGLSRLADEQVGLLTTGHRRLVELARVLAGPYDLLLLDEPSSGLDEGESRHFGEVLAKVVRVRGIGILLVEHDMSLVRQICREVFVLDFGRLLFAGTTDEMLSSEIVRAAYLGSEAVPAVEL